MNRYRHNFQFKLFVCSVLFSLVLQLKRLRNDHKQCDAIVNATMRRHSFFQSMRITTMYRNHANGMKFYIRKLLRRTTNHSTLISVMWTMMSVCILIVIVIRRAHETIQFIVIVSNTNHFCMPNAPISMESAHGTLSPHSHSCSSCSVYWAAVWSHGIYWICKILNHFHNHFIIDFD